LDDTVPRVKTASSGLVSVITVVFMCFLFLSEIYDWTHFEKLAEVGIDSVRTGESRINFDFDMIGLACPDFGMDVLDAAGALVLGATGITTSGTFKQSPLFASKNQHGKTGCKIAGYIVTSKVEGEFHIGLGKKTHKSENTIDHVHHFTHEELAGFNSSHHIHHFSFGEDFPGSTYPLDDVKVIIPEGEMYRYIYFLKIVPTTYKYLSGRVLQSYQFSVTSEKNLVNINVQRFWQPGVFFKYSYSAYQVTYKEQRRSFAHFLTRCCAIIGGVFVVSGLLSSLLYHMDLKFKKMR